MISADILARYRFFREHVGRIGHSAEDALALARNEAEGERREEEARRECKSMHGDDESEATES